jgi:hypothetical protein
MSAKSANPVFWILLSTILSASCLAKDYLVITSDPPGAKVEIDGDVVGRTPYTIEIPKQYLAGGPF